jgi:hypothetical protein
VVPIEQSLLYVQPIYLRAEQGELPELRRVIVVYGDRAVMRETLAQCLESIFGGSSLTTRSSTPDNLASLVQAALKAYQTGQEALTRGDWPGFGEAQQQLENLLRQLDSQSR